jgi:hypothetical protein
MKPFDSDLTKTEIFMLVVFIIAYVASCVNVILGVIPDEFLPFAKVL